MSTKEKRKPAKSSRKLRSCHNDVVRSYERYARNRVFCFFSNPQVSAAQRRVNRGSDWFSKIPPAGCAFRRKVSNLHKYSFLMGFNTWCSQSFSSKNPIAYDECCYLDHLLPAIS